MSIILSRTSLIGRLARRLGAILTPRNSDHRKVDMSVEVVLSDSAGNRWHCVGKRIDRNVAYA